MFQGIFLRRGDLGPVVGRKTADTAETSLKGSSIKKLGKDGETGWIWPTTARKSLWDLRVRRNGNGTATARRWQQWLKGSVRNKPFCQDTKREATSINPVVSLSYS